MLRTRFCELFGVELPIMLAGMGAIALADLAAAVSEAGGMGTLALVGFTPEGIHNEISSARKLTTKPLACNLLIPFLRRGVVEAVAAAPVEAVTLFWGVPAEYISRFKDAGKKVIWQCGSAEEAAVAKRAGVDLIIAQGVEAGGHVRGLISTTVLVPQVRDAIGDLPMLAAGGLADGRRLAAVLALGADGAVFGTRLLASRESAAHPSYKDRIVSARAEDTVHTKLYDMGWPDAAHRVLRTAVYEEWERAGRPESGKRPSEGNVVGTLQHAGFNALAFVMIGLQIGPILSRVDSPQRLRMLTFAAAVTVTVIAARAGWVMIYNRTLWTINRILGRRTPQALIVPPLNRSAVVAWCGMRGLVTLAAALALPDGSNGGVAFPYRDLIVLTAFSVVLGTLVLQGLTLRPLVLALGFEDDDAIDAEVRAGREHMLKAALASLGEVNTKAAAALYHEYEELLERADSSAAVSPEVRKAEEALRARAWAASRERLAQLRLTGAIGDPAFQLLEAELDRFELDTEVRSRW